MIDSDKYQVPPGLIVGGRRVELSLTAERSASVLTVYDQNHRLIPLAPQDFRSHMDQNFRPCLAESNISKLVTV